MVSTPLMRTDHGHLAGLAASPTVGIHVDADGNPLCAAPACRERAYILIRWDRPDGRGYCHCDQCRTTPVCVEHTATWHAARAPFSSFMSMPDGWRLGDGWPLTPPAPDAWPLVR